MVSSRRDSGSEHGVGVMLAAGCALVLRSCFAFSSRSHLRMLATIYATACCSSTSYLLPTYKLKYSWSRGCEIAESPWLTVYFQNQMQGPMIPLQEIRLSSSGSSMRTQDDTTFLFQTINSGAQLGRSGTLCIWGCLYFGSIIGPWLYLVDVMLYSCICVKWRL